MSRGKPGIRRSLLLLAVTLSIGILFLEIAVRLVLPQPYVRFTSSMWEKDPPRRFRMVPGAKGEISAGFQFNHTVSINAHGMRGPEVGPKKAGEIRILTLGDSYTFGHGASWEDTFVVLLEEELKGEYPGIVSLNGGVSGFGTTDELAWLEQYGLQLEPDLVIVAVCLGNDFKDSMEKEITEKVANDVPEAAERSGIFRFLFLRSHFYRLVARATPRKVRLALGFSEPWTAVYMRDAVGYHEDPATGQALESRMIIQAAFEKLIELSNEHDFRVAAMLIASDFHVIPRKWDALLGYAGLEPGSYAADVPQRYFLQMLGELGIPTLDLSPQFKTALESGEQLFFQYDPHFNEAGHRLTASALGQFIRTELPGLDVREPREDLVGEPVETETPP